MNTTYRETLLRTSRAAHHQLTSIGTMPADLLEDQRSPLLQHLHDGRVPVDQLYSSEWVGRDIPKLVDEVLLAPVWSAIDQLESKPAHWILA
jgi:hypothetical protein